MNRRKAVIFGASGGGRLLLTLLGEDTDVIFAVDNDPKKQAKEYIFVDNITVYHPDRLLVEDYDDIYIGIHSGYNFVYEQIEKMGLASKIRETVITKTLWARQQFLLNYAQICKERNTTGAVAELGVFQGHFAREINKAFPSSKLYLFDTFTGYDKQDIEQDMEKGYSVRRENDLDNTCVRQVIDCLPYPENAVIKMGYFPNTFDVDCIKEKFIFVNIDVDLYAPYKSGLERFYPRMADGGVILLNSYFMSSFEFKGGMNAVREFIEEHQDVCCLPIGDGCGIAIIK